MSLWCMSPAGVMRLMRRGNRKRTANPRSVHALVGPWLPEHRIGRPKPRRRLSREVVGGDRCHPAGVWDNLGRVAAEFVHLDRHHDSDRASRTTMPTSCSTTSPWRRCRRVPGARRAAVLRRASRRTGRFPRASRRTLRASTARAVSRRPTSARSRDAIVELRAGCMGTLVPSGFDAPMQARHARSNTASNAAHAGRPARLARRRRDVLRPHLQGQPAAGPARAPSRVPDPRRARACAWPTATSSGSRSPIRSSRCATPTARSTSPAPRRPMHIGDRRLGARASGSMAVAAPPLAVIQAATASAAYRPVLILVHMRLSSRTVCASWALTV